MRRKILSIGVAAVVTALLVAVAATPAQAASPPNTSPAAASRQWTPNGGYACEWGYVCTQIPYGGGYYVFKFYYYGRYNLSNWFGYTYTINAQTGGAALRLYDQYGSQVLCLGGPNHYKDWVNWDPIWSIALTSTPC